MQPDDRKGKGWELDVRGRGVRSVGAVGALALALGGLTACAHTPPSPARAQVSWRAVGGRWVLSYRPRPPALVPTPITLQVPLSVAPRVRGAQVVAVMTDMAMPPQRVRLRRTGVRTFSAQLLLPMAGPWRYTVTVWWIGATVTRQVRVWAPNG
jgi:hypothetical protein